MTEQDFEQLETLLDRLRGHLRHRIAIVNGIAGQGYSIGIYNSEGKMVGNSVGISLKSICDELLKENQ